MVIEQRANSLSHTLLGWSFVGLAIALFGAILLRTAWLCDDAYITYRTISILASHNGLTFNVGERVQAFTHPLWLLIEAGVFYFSHEFYYSMILLSIGISLAVVASIAIALAVRGRLVLAVFAIVTATFSRSYIDFSTSGLENPLTNLIIVIFILLLIDGTGKSSRTWMLAGLACLGALNRLDTLLIFSPVLIYMLWRRRDRGSLTRMVVGFVPLFIWEIFSVFYYGFPFPNTAYAKLNLGLPTSDVAAQGLRYLEETLLNDPITLAVIVIGTLLAFKAAKYRPTLAAVSVGINLYLVYVVRIGGDFMAGRYLAAPFIGSLLVAAELARPTPKLYAWLTLAMIAVGVLSPSLPILSGPEYGLHVTSASDRLGIDDERAYYFQKTGLFRTHPGYPDLSEWAIAGENARARGRDLVIRESIGLFGYYAGRNVRVIDPIGLSDPLLARLRPKEDADWRIGHQHRQIPEGYVATLITGTNLLVDQNLAEYYDSLHFIIAGPLWSMARVQETVRFNLGQWNRLLYAYDSTLPQESH